MKEALKRAITAAGGLQRFSVGVNAPSVHAVKAWRTTRIPAEYCPAIERLTGVRCEELRPDVPWQVLRNPAASSVEAA